MNRLADGQGVTERARAQRARERHVPPAAHALAERHALRRAELVEDYTQRLANPYLAAERGYVDDVIEPSQTRRKLIAGMRLLESKREEIPERKHGNVPL